MGVSIADAERAIKVRAKYLEALEDDEFALLPGDAYARGFLRNYADWLGLDAKELLRQYDVVRPPVVTTSLPEPMEHLEIDHSHVPRRAWIIVASVVGIAFLLWVGAGLVAAMRPPAAKDAQSGTAKTGGAAAAYRPPKGLTEIRVAPKGDARPVVEVYVNTRKVLKATQLESERRYLGKRIRVRTAQPADVIVLQDRRPVVLPTAEGTLYDQTFVGR
jgi:cytoskeletal protein RodZ